MKEIEALVILSSTPSLGSVKIRLLVQHFGSAINAITVDAYEVGQLPGFSPKIMENWGRWNRNDEWKREFDLAAQHGVSLITYKDPEYPKSLLELPDYPILLYFKGALKALHNCPIAIVGTRHASIYGSEMAKSIASEIARQRCSVVSGLARGIDTAAHEGALESGQTIAVIGSGLADIYPRENRKLAERIVENGLMISTFRMATPPDRLNFPQRNKIVAALSLGTLLIEGAVDSGAMLTMQSALVLKKKLFALPGRVDVENFHGNHRLIKSGQALLVENGTEVVAAFGDLFPTIPVGPLKGAQRAMLEKDEIEFLNEMPAGEVSFDHLLSISKLPVQKLSVLLMSLILKKVIKEFPGKQYIKLTGK